MSKFAIEVCELRKSYENVEALKGISFQVDYGEIFALLGPNGAGKTTTLEILEGHRKRTDGKLQVLGFDPAKNEIAFKKRIGIVLQKSGIDPYLTVGEALNLFSGYYPHPLDINYILDVTGLLESKETKIRRLSGGQQRRLDVAVGLAGNPDLLFLDEPTTGFDPSSRRNSWDMINNLRSAGKTILLTTHYMDEAEYLADRVAIMIDGRIVTSGSPKQLIGSGNVTFIEFRIEKQDIILSKYITEVQKGPDGMFFIETNTPEKTLYELTKWALDKNVRLENIKVSRPTLEDIYLRYVNEVTGQ